MDIRQIIAAEMERRQVSQRRLAEKTGLMQPRISDYLLNKRDIRAETLSKLLDALELEIRPKGR